MYMYDAFKYGDVFFLDLPSLLVFVQVLGLAVFFALCFALFFLALVGLVAFFVTLEASHGFSLLSFFTPAEVLS